MSSPALLPSFALISHFIQAISLHFMIHTKEARFAKQSCQEAKRQVSSVVQEDASDPKSNAFSNPLIICSTVLDTRLLLSPKATKILNVLLSAYHHRPQQTRIQDFMRPLFLYRYFQLKHCSIFSCFISPVDYTRFLKFEVDYLQIDDVVRRGCTHVAKQISIPRGYQVMQYLIHHDSHSFVSYPLQTDMFRFYWNLDVKTFFFRRYFSTLCRFFFEEIIAKLKMFLHKILSFHCVFLFLCTPGISWLQTIQFQGIFPCRTLLTTSEQSIQFFLSNEAIKVSIRYLNFDLVLLEAEVILQLNDAAFFILGSKCVVFVRGA